MENSSKAEGMKTYWFTIAVGEEYQAHAARLQRSLEAFHIPLSILTLDSADRMQAKHLKIDGILEAPKDCRRIVYLDADTFVLNADAIHDVNGAWRIPWRIPVENSLPKTMDSTEAARRLAAFYQQYDLYDFAAQGKYEGVEWNSGVIVGERDMMQRLAREWAVWWDRILEAFDGHFRRDQLSFRIAYAKVCQPYLQDGLPVEHNWVVSYYGINPQANILHRTMVRRVPWLDKAWNTFTGKLLSGEGLRTDNRVFEISRISRRRPQLMKTKEVDREIEGRLLVEVVSLCQPGKILLCGITDKDKRYLPLLEGQRANITCVNSISQVANDQLAAFDLVIFCGVDHTIPAKEKNLFKNEVVFCFCGLHDMSLYEQLFSYEYVRFLDYGFGIFSQSPKITKWDFDFPIEEKHEHMKGK